MTRKLTFIMAVASALLAGIVGASAAPPHHRTHHGTTSAAWTNSQGTGGYRGRCAHENAEWRAEPGYESIQDKDWAAAVGGRTGTCF